jgi:hypothetical protein
LSSSTEQWRIAIFLLRYSENPDGKGVIPPSTRIFTTEYNVPSLGKCGATELNLAPVNRSSSYAIAIVPRYKH